jgi:hypothetical protein
MIFVIFSAPEAVGGPVIGRALISYAAGAAPTGARDTEDGQPRILGD